jgi:tetratricopeptide (TPR) repeat protein
MIAGMTDDLYERYKESLRLGHVAVLKGALEEALEAYRDAASIAPSRALPHTSLGGVLLRLGHLEEALVEYAAAVARAPHDEGALLGQAEALTTAGQRVDAAQALDHVAEIQEAAGRLPEAADTLRRALELDEAPERARHQRGLLREIRLSAGDQAAEQLLARALRLRDEPSAAAIGATRAAITAPSSGRPIAAAMAAALEEQPVAEVVREEFAVPDEQPVEPAEALVPEPAPAPYERRVEPAWPESDFRAAIQRAELRDLLTPDEAASAGSRGDALESPAPRSRSGGRAIDEWPAADLAAKTSRAPQGATPAPDAVPVEAVVSDSAPGAAPAEPILAAVGVMDVPFDGPIPLGVVGESQHQPTGDELLAAAEAADLSGDSTTLRSLLLWTARAYAREGRFDAGLDATHRLLQKAPGDVDAHLVLVELYVARDWNTLAAEKLALLGRLAELNNDEATRQRLCAVANRAFPKDERLSSLCA